MFPYLKYSEADVDGYISRVTPEMVVASLGKARHDWFDLLNLISHYPSHHKAHEPQCFGS